VEREAEKKKWKSIKITEATYNSLARMGKGMGKAVEILVARQRKNFEKKLQDAQEVANDLASVLFESGIFDISFKGVGIEEVEEVGSVIRVKGFIDINIPSEEARKQVIETIKKRSEENDRGSETQQSAEDSE